MGVEENSKSMPTLLEKEGASRFQKWYRNVGCHHEEATQVLADGRAAVKRAQTASWWEWDKGSSIFFWRWPPDYQESSRVGIVPIIVGDPPSNKSRQPPNDDPEIRAKVKAKLENVMEKGYI